MKDSNESELNEIPNKELKRMIEQMLNKLNRELMNSFKEKTAK